MGEPHVISALVKKRSELSGTIEYYEELIKNTKEDLTFIDRTIQIFDPTYDLRTIKKVNKHTRTYFSTGEGKIVVINALKSSTDSLSTDEIGMLVAKNRSINLDGEIEVKKFNKSIIAILNKLERGYLVERTSTGGSNGRTIYWAIKELKELRS